MLFAPEKLYCKISSAIFLIFVCVFVNAAQTKKNAPKQTKNQPSKTQSQVKKTSSVKETPSKSSSSNKINKAEEARRRAAENARRQAALEAQRKREQAAREAQARKLAFLRGLRTQTVENIANDNTEGEDLEVRRAAINALGSRAGTVVVLEPQTGRILTIVNQDWGIRESFKPCSVVKLVTAVAGLNENLINQDGIITRKSFPVALDDALAYSNNSYFQTVGAGLGSEKLVSYARILGLGEPTGINMEGETAGKLPNGNNNLRIYSHGDDFEVTPLQLAVLVSAISNGGKLIVPQIPRTKFEKTNFRGAYRRQIALPSNSLRKIIPGMIGAASYGTARRGMDSSLDVAGKTGSCIGQGTWLGLFASVAPVENPRLAVVVITRGTSERGRYAAAVAAGIYNALRNRLLEKGKNTAKLPLELKPQTKVNAQTSARLDDAEDDDTDDSGSVRKGKKGDGDLEDKNIKIIVPVPKTVDKKEAKPPDLFPPVIITKKEEITRPRIVKNN